MQEAFLAARKGSGQPALTLAFTTDAYAPYALWRALLSQDGSSPLLGFQCGGVITREGMLEQGIGIATIGGDITVATSIETGLDGDPFSTGQRLGSSLATRVPDGLALLLPNGFLPGAYEFTRGLYASMGPDYRYVGGASGDNRKFESTCQFTESALEQDAVAAALVSGCAIGAAIGHGWEPHGDPLVITRSQGKRLYELDGRPAFQVYSERLGVTIRRDAFRSYSMVNPFGFVDISGNYVIRDARAVNDDDSMDFVTELPERAVARLMKGEVSALVEAARAVTGKATSEVDRPTLGLVFDCISRYLLMGDRFNEEIDALVSGVGEDVPFLGALTFGEIGSFEEVPLFHNKTIAAAVLGNR